MLYGFSIAYLAAPGTFDSTHVIEAVHSLPEFVKYTAKLILAAPFAFHSLNGLRHLAWDTGKCTLIEPCIRIAAHFRGGRRFHSHHRQGCLCDWLCRHRRHCYFYHRLGLLLKGSTPL